MHLFGNFASYLYLYIQLTENRGGACPSPENLGKEEKGMSRIGRMPVAIPAGVTVEIAEGNKVTVKTERELW